MNSIFPVLALAIWLMSTSVVAQTSYQLIDLGYYPTGQSTYAYGINSRGDIVGGGNFNPVMRPYDGQWQVLPSPLSTQYPGGAARSINSSGQAVGYVNDSTARPHACIWDSSGARELPMLPNGKQSFAWSINDSGMIVGDVFDWSSKYHACIWDASGNVRELVGYTSTSTARAWAINKDGIVVGENLHACLWDAQGNAHDLGVLVPNGYGAAFGINDAVQVVGRTSHVSLWDRAFIWDDKNGMRYLSLLPGTVVSEARAINNSGVAVGSSGSKAVWWNASGQVYELSSLPGSGVSSAWGVNDDGVIVGYSNGHAAMWVPVPEPSSLLTLICGLVGVGGMVLRRRK